MSDEDVTARIAAAVNVRIPVDRIKELRELAVSRGVQPTALIRAWVLAQLDAARDADDYVRRWDREVRAAGSWSGVA